MFITPIFQVYLIYKMVGFKLDALFQQFHSKPGHF